MHSQQEPTPSDWSFRCYEEHLTVRISKGNSPHFNSNEIDNLSRIIENDHMVLSGHLHKIIKYMRDHNMGSEQFDESDFLIGKDIKRSLINNSAPRLSGSSSNFSRYLQAEKKSFRILDILQRADIRCIACPRWVNPEFDEKFYKKLYSLNSYARFPAYSDHPYRNDSNWLLAISYMMVDKIGRDLLFENVITRLANRRIYRYLKLVEQFHSNSSFFINLFMTSYQKDIYGNVDLDKIYRIFERKQIHTEILAFAWFSIRTAGPAVAINVGVKFEEDCATALETTGWAVRRTSIVGDFGADLIIQRQSKSGCIQCNFLNKPVGITAVQEALGAKLHYKVEFGAVISSSGFTDAALILASSTGIFLLSFDFWRNSTLSTCSQQFFPMSGKG